MKNKIVIITGVNGGIGRAAAEIFKKNNWYIVGIDVKKGMKQGFIDEFYKFDISQSKSVRNFYKKFYSKHKNLDALINNAAIQISKKIKYLTEKDWDKTFAVNVKSIFILAKFFYPLLTKSQGSIVNISSGHAIVTSQNISAYASSKGAVLSLTRAMALEFAKDGIRVNAVLPGAVDTSMLRNGLNRGHLKGKNIESKLKELAQRTPLLRIGRPHEIAETIFFLADNKKSSFITGQAFIVDGGALAKLSTE